MIVSDMQMLVLPSVTPARRLAGRVVAVLAGASAGPKSVATCRRDALDLGFEGIPGDRHSGWTRKADARVPHYRRGKPIRNVRQLSLVSVEELGELAMILGIARIEPEWLGANIVVKELPRLSFLPRGTRLSFTGGATLSCEGYNPPCLQAGRTVAAAAGQITASAFVKAASRRRGIVASVEDVGRVESGPLDAVVPEQWVY